MSNPNDNKDKSLEEIIAETMALKHAREQGVAPQNKTTSTPHTTQHSPAQHSASAQPQHHTSGAAHSGSTQHHSSGAQHSGSTSGHSSARPVIANGQPKSSQHHSGQKSSSAAGHSGKKPTSQNGRPHKSTQGTVKKTSNGTKPAQSGKNSKGTKNGKKKKMSKKKKLLIALAIVLGVIIIIICVLVGIIYHYINKINIVPDDGKYEILDSINIDDDLTSEPDSPQEDIDAVEDAIKKNLEDYAYDVMKDKDVYNILLIGTDTRDPSERGRSDSMILVSINKKTDKIIMTSFLRDIYLAIPDVESTRLNHAYAYGGPDLLVRTIEDNFKIEINKYVQVNFYSFETVVDALDGVEIDVTDEEVPYINAGLYEINSLEGRNTDAYTLSKGGTYTLNGAQALSYARIRYVGTDFGRSERQRTVLSKLFEKMKGASITQLTDLLDEILPKVTTNMQEDEIFSLILNSATYLSYDLEQCRVPADDTWQYLTIRGMSVIGIDFAANIDYLRDNIYGN